MDIHSQSETETLELGKRISRSLNGGEVIKLFGSLGSGKTIFTKGLALGLGINVEVTSPTYVYLRSYRGGRLKLKHYDLYRVQKKEELEISGLLEEAPDFSEIFVIEWPEIIDGLLKEREVRLYFENINENKRLITSPGISLWVE